MSSVSRMNRGASRIRPPGSADAKAGAEAGSNEQAKSALPAGEGKAGESLPVLGQLGFSDKSEEDGAGAEASARAGYEDGKLKFSFGGGDVGTSGDHEPER